MQEEIQIDASRFTTPAALAKEVLVLLDQCDRTIVVLASQKLWDGILQELEGYVDMERVTVLRINNEEDVCTPEP